MKLNYKDYKGTKYGAMCSVGTINDILIFEMLTGFGCVPEYRVISEDEFNSFGKWSEKKIHEILNREIVAGVYSTLS